MLTINASSARFIFSVLFMAGTTGCAHYQARPLNLAESATKFNSGSFSDPQLLERLDALHLSETVRSGQWNRAQLLVVASERNPKISVAKEQVYLVDAAKKTATALPNPTLSLGAEYNISQTAESPWLWSVSTDWLLDVGLRRQLRIKTADANVQAVRLDYAEALWVVRSELRTSLLNYLISARRIQLLTEAQTHQERLLQMQRQRVMQGESSQSDALQIELELARTQGNLADATRIKSQAQAQIATALGMPLSALESQSFVWDDLLQVTSLDEQNLTHLRDKALLSRTDLERALIDYQRSEFTLRQAIREQYPQFSIGPGYSWDHGVKKVSLGLSLGVPVFNRNQGPIAEAQAARDLAGQQAMALQAQILQEIDLAHQVYQSSITSLQAVIQQHDIAEKLLAQVQQSLALGAADQIEVITAQMNVNIQSLAVLDAVERMQQSLGQLEDALRTPLSGPEVALTQQALLKVDRVQ